MNRINTGIILILINLKNGFNLDFFPLNIGNFETIAFGNLKNELTAAKNAYKCDFKAGSCAVPTNKTNAIKYIINAKLDECRLIATDRINKEKPLIINNVFLVKPDIKPKETIINKVKIKRLTPIN